MMRYQRIAHAFMGYFLLSAAAHGEGFEVASQYRAVFTKPPVNIPSNSSVDGPLLGNGDLLVAMGGNPEAPRFYIGKNDLWRMPAGGGAAPRPLARLELNLPSLSGASYHVEQTLGDATTTAIFEKDGCRVSMRCWVAATEPLLVLELEATGGRVSGKSALRLGGTSELPRGTLRNTGNRINLGREQYRGGRWYFNGMLDEVRVYDRALLPVELAALKAGDSIPDQSVRHWAFDGEQDNDVKVVDAVRVDGVKGKALDLNGRSSYVDSPPVDIKRALTVSAFVYVREANATQYIVSQGEWNQGWSLGLSSGKLRMAVGATFEQTTQSVPVGRWVHVGGVFDGAHIHAYVDGREESDNAEQGVHREADGVTWVERHIEQNVRTPAAAACACRVLGMQTNSFVLEPGHPVTLVAAVDSIFDHDDYAARVVKTVAALSDASDLSDIRQAHIAWWHDYWNTSFVELPDKLLEQRYYLSLYVIGSASRNPSFPPGIFGWVTTDAPAWNGDYHMNYNHVAPFYGLGVANRIEQLDPCIQPILDSEAGCRALCKSALGIDGIYMPVGIGPKGSIGHNALMQKSNAAYSCVPIAERWYTTYDFDFARKAYPFVEGVAQFWKNWLKWEDGRYVIYKDAVHENSGADVNPIVSLALVRMVMNLVLDMSTELSVDEGHQETWRHIRDHISAYPTCTVGDLPATFRPRDEAMWSLPIFRYTEKGTPWWRNNTVGIQHIFPAGGIGLDSAPEWLERARNEIMVMNRWQDFNGMNSFYAAAARVSYDPNIILRDMRTMLEKVGLPNGMIAGNPHGMEHQSIVPNAVQEMLMQSHEGVIRLFPCWPKSLDARFGTLRARGAFLVSSELKDGRVTAVQIASEKGRDCTVQNPWPGQAVRLERNGAPAEAMNGKRFTFASRSGETIRLKPE